jgi:hypothetical protein
MADWGMQLEAVVCETCDWSYLLPPDTSSRRCPHCFNATLTAVEQPFSRLPYTHPPEMVIKPQVSREKAAVQIQAFASGIAFCPKDLTPANLVARLTHTYIPLWLVDSDVSAVWQAEIGFNYQAVSHREKFTEDIGEWQIMIQGKRSWQTEQTQESRIRWEPFFGRLNRTYHNHHAPALEDEFEMYQRLGDYDLSAAEPYDPELLLQSFIRLPNRPPEDAWPAAEPGFMKDGTAECQKAAQADHIRDFRWTAEYDNFNWTQLLRPVYATYYLDDDGRPQPIYVNGQTGHISGSRRASMHRAQGMTINILIIAILFFLLGIAIVAAGTLWQPVFSLSIPLFLLAVAVAFVSLLPLYFAWRYNDKHKDEL